LPWARFNCGPRAPGAACEEEGIRFYRRVIDFAQALGGTPATFQGLPQWLRPWPPAREGYAQLLRMARTLLHTRRNGA
jgi:sugar phosphate isomerase/epimerase